jgi:CHAT domain-containing protein
MVPIKPLLGDAKSVLLAPEGVLNLVPFAALVDEQGRYLVETLEVSYLTSGRDLLRMQSPAAPRSGPLVLANPAYGSPPLDVPDPGRTSRSGRNPGRLVFPALPFTATEARALKPILSELAKGYASKGKGLEEPTVLLDVDATERAIKDAQAPLVLHVATHGFFFADQKLTRTRGRPMALDPSSPAPTSRSRAAA